MPKVNPSKFYLILAVLAALGAGFSMRPEKPEYDLLIVGGHILDGSGNPWSSGAVAVRDGKIAAVGHLVNPTAKRVIDATGLVVAPGFIDLHGHSDYT